MALWLAVHHHHLKIASKLDWRITDNFDIEWCLSSNAESDHIKINAALSWLIVKPICCFICGNSKLSYYVCIACSAMSYYGNFTDCYCIICWRIGGPVTMLAFKWGDMNAVGLAWNNFWIALEKCSLIKLIIISDFNLQV